MNFSKISAIVFGIVFIIILYVIIYFALKIMYKDVKGGGRRRQPQGKKSYGIEIVDIGKEESLKKGTVIPVKGIVSLGRKENNSVVLVDPHVSGNHARFVIRNNILFIEDLNSTNGTYVNGRKVTGRAKLFGKDEVKIGSSCFRVL
ncbi:FHA domain-containing protein [Clostridium sp. SHJSY1]|uniref:FHA domain-containing protein n=1 Tax=Clostridium sp. SHJSY1 TaxID=2942483 RepID=UPI0028769FAC|nr:FHA domain-containing protein [Clostridium sp. SHJSY1]MDS0526226.1 FHA domain-containing protein [Clostridium sp. SHJSY1]